MKRSVAWLFGGANLLASGWLFAGSAPAESPPKVSEPAALLQTAPPVSAPVAPAAPVEAATPDTNAVAAVPAERGSGWLSRLGSRGVRVHDPSTIVKCQDEYWVFHTGRGVSSYHSKDLVHWEAGPRIFTNPPSWAAEAVPENRNTHYWAPDVIHLDGRYLVYYSISTFGKNTSAIGLVSNPTLDPADPRYRWTDEGIVIQSKAGDRFNAIDPAVTQDADGNLWLAFGSFWSGIRLIQLDPKTGRRLAPDSPNHLLAHFDSIEAAFIHRHAGYYYLFVNWGICCRGVNSTYNMRVGRSARITGPYVDKNGKDLRENGGTLLLDTVRPFIGPGHAGIISEKGTNWLSCHFYDGTRRGMSTLAILPLQWEPDGWPKVELPPVE
jgi:arabinan endo-1,5-alpha-L-arabinosidase